jgi:hypothetical protein
MLEDIFLDDVVIRVLSHFFPDVHYKCITGIITPPPEGYFQVKYDGDLKMPRNAVGINIGMTGHFKSPWARKFVERLPSFIISDYEHGYNQDLYGNTISMHGLYSKHLEFDDRLVASEVFVENEENTIGERHNSWSNYLPQIFNILRIISGFRYESNQSEVSLILSTQGNLDDHLGPFSLDAFEKNKSLLTICSGGAAGLEINHSSNILNLIPLDPTYNDDLYVPTSIKPLASYSKENDSVCVFLDQSQSIFVLKKGMCLFRYTNGKWSWIDSELSVSELGNTEVSRKLIQVACDLADSGHGGILVVINRDTHQKMLKKIVNDDCVPFLSGYDLESFYLHKDIRGKFNAWLLKDKNLITELPGNLLLNLCAMDGATFINEDDGEILGYGAVVKVPEGIPEQGARTSAAKYLSKEFGNVIKISEDRNAVLFKEGKLITRIW